VRPGPASHTYFSQRLRLHYVDWGNPDRPPLLLLHGGRDHCRNWDWVAEALRDDWHVVAPDLRGHGDSQWSPDGSYWMAGYLYDVAQLVHQQRLAPVTIIAHSLGGVIALRYAGIYPDSVKKLVAVEGLGPPPARLKEREKDIATRMDEWIREQRTLSGRLPRKYASIDPWRSSIAANAASRYGARASRSARISRGRTPRREARKVSQTRRRVVARVK